MTHRGIHTDGRSVATPNPGPAPMLQWLAIDRLVIDNSYQRPLGAGNWKAIEEQSRAFAWVNSQAIRVSVFHIFKAAFSAGDDWAVRADAAVSGGGCRLMRANVSSSLKKPGAIYAIGLIRTLIEAGQDKAITSALAALRAVPSLDRPVVYTDFILRPWINAIAASNCPPHDVLVRALELRDPFKVIEAAQSSIDRSVPQAVKAREALRQMIVRAESSAEVAA